MVPIKSVDLTVQTPIMGRRRVKAAASDSETEDTVATPDAPPPEVRSGVARMPEEDARDDELPSGWIQPTKPTHRTALGRYRRPLEEPPMDGYVWNNTHGVWAPSGKYLEEIRKIKIKRVRKQRKRSMSSDSTLFNAVPMIASSSSNVLVAESTTSVVPVAEDVAPEEPIVKTKKSKTPDPPTESPVVADPVVTEAMNLPASGDAPLPPENVAAAAPPPLTILSQENTSQTLPPSSNSSKKKRIPQEKEPEKDHDDDDDDDGFHPNSLWQEPNTSDLTLYEQHRKPRPAPTGTFICSMDALRTEFRCAICLDILRNARIVRECLHRFCESCIEHALTFQNVEAVGGRRKECPICRVYIPSRRSLAPDPYMDTLVARLLDNLVWEGENDPKVYLTSPSRARGRAFIPSARQDDDDGPDEFEKIDPPGDKGSSPTEMELEKPPPGDSKLETAVWQHWTPGLIHILLVQDPNQISTQRWDDLSQPYITLAADATTLVIQNFLRRKHGCARDTPITVWTTYKTKAYVPSVHNSLHYLLMHRADAFNGRYMPMYYRVGSDKPPVRVPRRKRTVTEDKGEK